jgi:hypothetical protein
VASATVGAELAGVAGAPDALLRAETGTLGATYRDTLHYFLRADLRVDDLRPARPPVL